MRDSDKKGESKRTRRVAFYLVGGVLLWTTVQLALQFTASWPAVVILGMFSFLTLIFIAPEKAREAARLFGSMARAFRGGSDSKKSISSGSSSSSKEDLP